MTRACKIILLTLLALLFSITRASADGTSSMVLTSAGSNVLDGVYVGPYVATVGGVANTPVICDDYEDESYVPESWTAYVSTFPNLADVKFTSPSEQQDYDEVAYLALELLAAPPNSLKAGEIQYALWGVFDPNAITALTAYSATDGAAAGAYLLGAEKNYSTLTPTQLAEFTFYTPDPNDPLTCNGKSCPKTPPQEFLVVNTPEPASFVLVAIGVACVLCLKRRSICPSAAAQS
jgi:hypothetical protein